MSFILLPFLFMKFLLNSIYLFVCLFNSILFDYSWLHMALIYLSKGIVQLSELFLTVIMGPLYISVNATGIWGIFLGYGNVLKTRSIIVHSLLYLSTNIWKSFYKLPGAILTMLLVFLYVDFFFPCRVWFFFPYQVSISGWMEIKLFTCIKWHVGVFVTVTSATCSGWVPAGSRGHSDLTSMVWNVHWMVVSVADSYLVLLQGLEPSSLIQTLRLVWRVSSAVLTGQVVRIQDHLGQGFNCCNHW